MKRILIIASLVVGAFTAIFLSMPEVFQMLFLGVTFMVVSIFVAGALITFAYYAFAALAIYLGYEATFGKEDE